MDKAGELRAKRNVLELQLVLLEQGIQAQCRWQVRAAPELAERMPSLFDRLRLVNEKLAELRRPRVDD
ncbi:hypothetical protein [Azohydromonas australica]|uniref:hypothetical protein n=1 Tax=Azohydromonas australica TaxID=364039 RepID=UPI0005BE572B|nr:hypothetical protein [Azohydromonas australica]